jgi:hypothetical protein
MKRQCNTLKKSLLCFLSVMVCLWADFSQALPEKRIELYKFDPVPILSPEKLKTIETPDFYLNSMLRQGLNLVLPQPVQKGLKFEAGYDRFEHLPTGQIDLFIPLRSRPDKTMFFAPRFSFSGSRESLSLTAGFRRLLTADSMLGVYAFHDWVRPRRLSGEFLREIGLGVEFSAAPGKFSDLTLKVNTYFPVNERYTQKSDGSAVIKEMLPTGVDANLNFLLPAFTKYADIRLEGQLQSYHADATAIVGYKTGLDIQTRNGLLGLTLETGHDTRYGSEHKIQGTVKLTFDWMELAEGRNPFSAPYKVSDLRFAPKMQDRLYDKVSRKYDLPMDKTEAKMTLLTQVDGDTLSFSGAFPHLSNSSLTLQVSQSPWADHVEVPTDNSGDYTGQVRLTPGIYRIRLIHKPTGRVTAERSVVIAEPAKDKPEAPDAEIGLFKE